MSRRVPTSVSRTIRDTLVEVTRDPDAAGATLARVSGEELDAVLRAGVGHRLGSALVTGLQTARLPVPGWLETHRFDVATQRAHLMATLATIAPLLEATGIPWVVLKGPVTASAYERFEEREFADLDILVPGERLADVLAALDDAGVDAVNRNWDAYVRYRVAEFPVGLAGTSIDLHWHIIALDRTRRRFTIRTDELLARRQPVDIGGVACHQLDPEDNAIHLALHAGLAGAYRLGSLRDIHETVRSGDLDWDLVVDRARLGGAGPLVGHVLDRCRIVLGAPVPPEVAERLTPRWGLRCRRWLDAHPLPATGSYEKPYSGFLVATWRTGIISTLGRARELLSDRLATALGRPARWSAYDPEGPLFWQRPSGGEEAYAAYLDLAAGSPPPR